MKEKFRAFFPEKWPSLRQCVRIFRILNEKEKSILQIAIGIFAVSLIVLCSLFYFGNTKPTPSFGGKYSEGMIGYPQLLNPVYSSVNDVDRDVSLVLFSSIFEQSSSENVFSGLAKEVTSGGTFFDVSLKEGLRWSDGEKLTAEDVVFTIETIQNPKTRSPLRPDWTGIKAEKISDVAIRFHLEKESPFFLNRLSLQPIPKHIWQDISPEGMPLSTHNLSPIGSGPYRLKEIKRNPWERIELITLEINPYYHGKKPNIEEISFVFFDNSEAVIAASRKGEIQGFAAVNPKNYDLIIKETKFNGHSFHIPRTFGLFFNLESMEDSELIRDKEFRQALNYGTDKESLMEKVLSSNGWIVNSPVLPEIYDFSFRGSHEFNFEKAGDILDNLGLQKNEHGIREKLLREEKSFEFTKDLNTGSQGEEVRELQKCLSEDGFYEGEITGFYGAETRDAVTKFQEEFKDEILSPSGFSKGTGMVSKNTRVKLNELCSFTPRMTTETVLTITTVDQPLMAETAEEIKRQWEELGIRVEISLFSISSLENEIIKPRNYEILLFGKAFEAMPDPFPFWHSSQKTEYGFNLSLYSSEKTDSLLEKIREEISREERDGAMEELHNAIIEDVPAIFLFNPDYVFFAHEKIKGVDPGVIFSPSQRFQNIENWYINTKRIWEKKK